MTTETKPRRARNARPKIERAALGLFIQDGVDATTTREIAAEAGVSEGALYRHYKGKDELALSLFMQTHDRLSSMLQDAFAQGGSLDEIVHRVVAAYCKLADEDWLLFSYHLVSMNRFLPYDVRRTDDPVSIVESMLKALMDAGEIPKGDPALLASMALGVVLQAGQNKIYNRLQGPFSQHVDAMSRAILAIILQK